MNIAALGDWLSKQLEGNKPAPQQQPAPQPHRQQPQTIQPGMPLPTFQSNGPDDYSVQGLAPGASTFAPYQGLGVLPHPTRGPVFFDPTGRQSGGGTPYTDNYLAMPMQQIQLQPMQYMQKIGGGY